MDVLIDELADLVDIQPKHRKRFRKLLEESKSFESVPIRTRLTDEEVARFIATLSLSRRRYTSPLIPPISSG
jgi:penicillin-binding protein 2